LAAAACEWRDEYALPSYQLLAFGSVSDRAKFVAADWGQRFAMALATRLASGIRSDDGHWQELSHE
jgi:hypothetical protein